MFTDGDARRCRDIRDLVGQVTVAGPDHGSTHFLLLPEVGDPAQEHIPLPASGVEDIAQRAQGVTTATPLSPWTKLSHIPADSSWFSCQQEMYSARSANRSIRPAISLSGSAASSPAARSAVAARYRTTPSRVRLSARIDVAPSRA